MTLKPSITFQDAPQLPGVSRVTISPSYSSVSPPPPVYTTTTTPSPAPVYPATPPPSLHQEYRSLSVTAPPHNHKYAQIFEYN